MLLLPLSGQGTATGYPDVYLEIAFTTGPNDTPVWERIPNDDIRSISYRRGRSRELDRYEAGGMTVVLDNRARTYDPNYSSGSHYGNVLPMRRIRLTEVYDNSYRRFTGYINGWGLSYVNKAEAVAVVTATDGFKVLGGGQLLSSAYAEEVDADGPVHLWRLGEPAGSTTVSDEAGQVGTVNGAPTFGTSGLITRDSNTAASFDGVDDSITIPGGLFAGGDNLTVECVMQTTDAPAVGESTVLVSQSGGASINLWSLFMTTAPTNRLQFSVRDNVTGTLCFVQSSVAVNDGDPHHVAAVKEGVTLKIYVDGVDVSTGASGSPSTLGAAPFGYIGRFEVFDATSSAFYAGTLQSVAIYDYVLPADRILAHSDARATPWDGDTSGERLGRILDAVGWPDADRDIDTGETTLQSAALATTALEHAQKVADSEFGRLFMTGDGKVRFISRQNQWKPPYNTSVATFSDDGADTGYVQIGYDYSDQLIRNRVTVSRNDGVAITVSDDDSIDDFGIQSYTRDGLLQDDDALSAHMANWIANQYADPKLRVSRLTVKPRYSPTTAFPDVFSLELGDRVTIEQTPPGGGSAFSQDSIIESISETILPGKDWTFTFDLSPGDDPLPLILDSTVSGYLGINVLGF